MVMMVRQAVGDREVEKVNSSDENLVIVEEDEEEAYQKISDEFGVEPVRIVMQSEGLEFDRMMYDKTNQIAEMWYNINGETLVCFINASYGRSSVGIDVEDSVINSYIMNEGKEYQIEVKEYETKGEKEKRFSAQFSYWGLEYFLIGVVSEADFNTILENLFF